MDHITGNVVIGSTGLEGPHRSGLVDRWIFVATALLIIAVVLTGFIPSSLTLLERVSSGTRGPISATLHLHAIFMGSWLLLLAIQAGLMANRRAWLHMRLGIVALLLVPAMVITGALLVPQSMAQVSERIAAMPPAPADELSFLLPMLNNIMLVQLSTAIVFPLLVGLGLYFRRRRPETHKRLMVFATATPLAAATDRLEFLPSTLPDNPATMLIYPLLVLLPLLAWDLSKGRKLDLAWKILAVVVVIRWLPVWLIWDSEWWAGAGPRLAGIS